MPAKTLDLSLVKFLALLGISAIAVACNTSQEPEPKRASAPTTAAATDNGGPLLKTEFEVKPTFGDYVFEEEKVLHTLRVSEGGTCEYLEKPENKPNAQKFSGRWEGTFDGIRCEIKRVNGKPKEAEAYFKVTPQGYEFKTANLLTGVTVPKSFTAKK